MMNYNKGMVQSGMFGVCKCAGFLWIFCRLEKRYLLVQSPEKSYFSHLQKKYCLLKEKILGLYLGGAHHRAYYYCFGGTKKECLYFLCYGAHPLSLVPEPFPLRNKFFLVNVKNSFFPEAELEKSVFTTNPPFIA